MTSGKTVVFGHTPLMSPLIEKNKMGIDTGAVYSGKLTCVELPEIKIYQAWNMKIIECVPNFSEGHDRKKIEAIARVFKSFPNVRLVDFSGDADHNRSVFTFLGKPEDVLEAALAACGKALKLIDMREQIGVHPRLGAVDVVPFIPLSKAKMKDAVDLAHVFGQQLYERFGVPIYFYGHAAIVPGRNRTGRTSVMGVMKHCKVK